MKLRRGLGFLPETLQMPGVERGRKRQDLQRHAASQRQLDGLVDDAHSPPADLTHDLEVAQGVRRNGVIGIPRRLRRIARQRTCQGSGLMDKLQAVEALAEGFRQVGIAPQPAAAIRPPAGFQFLEVLSHGLRQSWIVWDPIARLRVGTRRIGLGSLLNKSDRRLTTIVFRGVFTCRFGASPLFQRAVRRRIVRDTAHFGPPITCRSCASPRTQSFSTLSSERPIRWLTSGKVSPSRCRRTITSR